MQKLEFFKLVLFAKNSFLKPQSRLIQTSINVFNNEKLNDSIKTRPKYEEYEEPFRTTDIKGLQDVGLLKEKWSWPKYNRIIYPPLKNGEQGVTPFVHHMRTYIKYSHKKLWFPASMIAGMSVDEAIKQLSFHKSKGAEIIKETLLEAQELAVQEHNIEFKSNLWVSFSNVGKATRIKGLRKHRGPRYGIVNYNYSHYFVRLEEGLPPENFRDNYESYEERAKNYIEYLRGRKIICGL